jgi:signal transduction histidine kinase/CheY-like chemotaxis protein/HPt (histidine-containing phosphotransfer) domain-containing protein
MNALARIRTFRAMMLAACGIFAFHMVRNTLFARPNTATVQAFGAAGTLACFLLSTRVRTERSARALVHVGLSICGAVLTALSILTGQRAGATPFALSILGPVAAYVLGVRAALIWAVVTFAAVLCVDFAGAWFGLRSEFVQGVPEFLLTHGALHLALLVLAVVARQAFDAQLEELRAREATIRHQADDLVLARDRALEASRLKSEFLATMSHEIRTPLNGVLGMTTLLADSELSHDQREMVSLIGASGDSLLVTLNDILDFSKIEAGKLELEEAPFDVRDCVDGTLELLSATAASRGLELAAIVAADVPTTAFGDAARLQQMLVNLVGNALKFTEVGEVVVEVVRVDANALRFLVRDTGIGVVAERLSFLFDPFTQADASTTRRFGGTGLGLAIVHRLAERMGGRAWAESVVGEGSTFAFEVSLPPAARGDAGSPERDLLGAEILIVESHAATRDGLVAMIRDLGGLPLVCVSAAGVSADDLGRARAAVLDAVALGDSTLRAALLAHDVAVLGLARLGTTSGRDPIVFRPVRRAPLFEALSSALRREAITDAQSSPALPVAARADALRVLVAEDNPVGQRVARLLLERLGHRAVVVGSGLEAIEALRTRRYDVLLTDLQMPELDGLETARRVRAELPADAQPRIIAMTASALPEHRDACTRAGMDDFVAKPVQVRELLAALARATRLRTPRPFSLIAPPAGTPAPPGAREEGLVDEQRLDSLRLLTAENPATLTELLSEFAINAMRLVEAMEAALAAADGIGLQRAAHSLKGNAGTFGASELAVRAARVELRAKDLGPAAAAEDVRALRRVLADTTSGMESALRRA